MPELYFAHSFEAEQYRNKFPAVNDRIEVSYISRGSCTLFVDGVSYELKQGDITCNLFHSPYSVESIDYHCHHTVCAFAQYSFADIPLNGLCLPHVVPHTKYDDQIRKCIDDFVYSPQAYEYSKTKTSGMFLDLLCRIDEAARSYDSLKSQSAINLIQKAKKYIYSNIHIPMTQREIAEHLTISPEYLCSIFRKNEGITVMKYINTVKLRNIKTLMMEKNLKLYEAAAAYGYTDPNYVSALYKKIFGHNITDTPNSYDNRKK